jgi:hypothetical protein
MIDKINANLFANDSEGNVSTIETSRGRVTITPTEFLAGWTGHRPPFSNNGALIPSLGSGQFDVSAWANVEKVRSWVDDSGKRQRVTVERRGNPVKRPGDPTPPLSAEQETLTYLNVSIKPKTFENK